MQLVYRCSGMSYMDYRQSFALYKEWLQAEGNPAVVFVVTAELGLGGSVADRSAVLNKANSS